MAYAKLSHKKRKAVTQTIEKLMVEPVATSLMRRRLKGSADLWIANAPQGNRIIYQMTENDVAQLLDVGEHDATYRKWNRRKR